MNAVSGIQRVGQPLQHNYTDTLTGNGSLGIAVEGAAVSVGGVDAALFI